MLLSIAKIVELLDGRKEGRGYRCRCPVHGGRSLIVSEKNATPLWHCMAGCDGGAVTHALRDLGLLSGRNERKDYRPSTPESPSPTDVSARAMAIFGRGRDLCGTLAERYFAGRDLDIGLLDPDAVRFLPGNEKWPPSVVALVTHFTDARRVVGLQFTPLKPDGTRGDRRFLAGTAAKGGAIRLISDAKVTTHLGLAEGLETALSVMTGLKRAGRMLLPVWSTCGKDNMAGLPVLPAVEILTIYADSATKDKPSGDGTSAARRLGQRWDDSGRKVFVCTSPRGDWNDG